MNEPTSLAKSFLNMELERIESKYELESDEGGTAREKAEAIYKAENPKSFI